MKQRFDSVPFLPLHPGLPPLWREEDAGVSASWENEGGPVVRRRNVTRPTISFFPGTGAGPRPCVVVCPGGGYNYLAWNHEGLDAAHWLNSLGLSAAVLEYRCPGRRDAALADARRAMRLVRANAAEWNVDPAKVGIMGFSAGGHLAVRVCCSAEPDVPAADAVDALCARPDFALPIYPAYVDAPGGGIDPALEIDASMPPVFVAVSCDDPYAPSAFAFASALRAAGARFEMHVFESGGHGWGVPTFGTVHGRWLSLASEWLLRRVSGEAPGGTAAR